MTANTYEPSVITPLSNPAQKTTLERLKVLFPRQCSEIVKESFEKARAKSPRPLDGVRQLKPYFETQTDYDKAINFFIACDGLTPDDIMKRAETLKHVEAATRPKSARIHAEAPTRTEPSPDQKVNVKAAVRQLLIKSRIKVVSETPGQTFGAGEMLIKDQKRSGATA